MFQRIDFDKTEPFFVNDEGSRWYFDTYLQKYIRIENDYNLPALDGVHAVVVINAEGDSCEYVLLDNQQNVLKNYPYCFEGYGQMIAFINFMKLDKYFDNNGINPEEHAPKGGDRLYVK